MYRTYFDLLIRRILIVNIIVSQMGYEKMGKHSLFIIKKQHVIKMLLK